MWRSGRDLPPTPRHRDRRLQPAPQPIATPPHRLLPVRYAPQRLSPHHDASMLELLAPFGEAVTCSPTAPRGMIRRSGRAAPKRSQAPSDRPSSSASGGKPRNSSKPLAPSTRRGRRGRHGYAESRSASRTPVGSSRSPKPASPRRPKATATPMPPPAKNEGGKKEQTQHER